jgi:hypothetical protein
MAEGTRPGLTLPEAAQAGDRCKAAILDISHATLYRIINAGQHDARKIDNKTVITHGSICRFIEALPKAGKAA